MKPDLEVVNLAKIQSWIDIGRLDATKPITMKAMYDSGLFKSIPHGVKLLGDVRMIEIGVLSLIKSNCRARINGNRKE